MKYIQLLVMLCGLCAADYILEKGIGTFVPEPVSDATTIGMENGFSFDTRIGEPQLPSNLKIESYEPGAYGYFLVQFNGPIYTVWKEQLSSKGVQIYAYWPNYAYLVGMRTDQVETVKALPFVRWIGIFQPAYKVHSELFNKHGERMIDVQLYPDTDISKVLTKIKATGAIVLDYQASAIGKLVYLKYDLSRIADIARIPEVLAIVPWNPDLPVNENSQWVCQKGWASADTSRPIWRKGIRGQRMRIGYSDTGIRTTHNAYRDPAIAISDSGHYPNHRKIVAYLLYPRAVYGDVGTTYHGSHVGGTIAGDDSINGGTDRNDGIAYKGRLFFVDIANASGSLVTPAGLDTLYNMIYYDVISGPVRQHSASWGRTGTGYIDRDAWSDAYHWKHKDFLDLFAAGNSGPTYRSIIHAAYAKNVLAVGALQNGTLSNQIASFSSRGPTVDGRIKPTVCTPGQNIMSVDGAGDTGYKLLSGTSMATPACNGSAGLIRQYLKEGWYPSGAANPPDSFGYISQALMRAMLIVSADPNVGTFVVPDSNIGFGRVDLDSVLYFTGEQRKLAIWDDLQGLNTGQYKDFQIQVNDSTLAFRAAMVWTDTAAAIGSNPNIVNNLNLQLTNPYGTYYRGNQYSGGQSVADPASYDIRNVEEVARINVPRKGIWTIRVTAQSVAYPPQPFALVLTGGIAPVVGIEDGALPKSINCTSMISITPNPTATKTTINLQLANRTQVTLRVFDVTGRLVKTIINENRERGCYTVYWAIDKNIASGVYFIHFESSNVKQTQPVIVVR